jgi:hypothetical protein
MKIDVETRVDPEYQRAMDTIATSLVHVAKTIDQINALMIETQRILQDVARNYRNALGRRASLHIADGADETHDESAGD